MNFRHSLVLFAQKLDIVKKDLPWKILKLMKFLYIPTYVLNIKMGCNSSKLIIS